MKKVIIRREKRTMMRRILNVLSSRAQRRLERIRTAPIRIHHKFRPSTQVSNGEFTWKYSTPTRETWVRAKTMFTKEPKTIDWLNTLPSKGTLWDIGASVGCFSLYAAKSRNAEVVSFEPMASTYSVLEENIHLNNLGSYIFPFCVAFSDKTNIGQLYLTSRVAGTSEHSVSEHIGNLDNRAFISSQSSITYTVDEFVKSFNLRIPTFIKIDVDGTEAKIFDGAYETLRQPTLQSILVEIDERDEISFREVLKLLNTANFQVECRTPLKKGSENTMFNYIFSRKFI